MKLNKIQKIISEEFEDFTVGNFDSLGICFLVFWNSRTISVHPKHPNFLIYAQELNLCLNNQFKKLKKETEKDYCEWGIKREIEDTLIKEAKEKAGQIFKDNFGIRDTEHGN